MEKHFVTFLSPGTFFSEETTREISSWNPEEAARMAASITERYNAKPFAFQFSTRSRGDNDLDSKVTAQSGRYYLRARIETIEQIRERADPNEQILLSNMECNGWDTVVRGCSPYQWSQPLEPSDVVLEKVA